LKTQGGFQQTNFDQRCSSLLKRFSLVRYLHHCSVIYSRGSLHSGVFTTTWRPDESAEWLMASPTT